MTEQQLALPGLDDAILILSIREEHAKRIFLGAKLYELRKALPRTPFRRVYLYQSGGEGIVGAFDVGEVIRQPVPDLWRIVGERATSEDRFFDYFAGFEFGYAIRASNPVRFSRPLRASVLRDYAKTFTAPQSYLLVRKDHQLHALLEGVYQAETRSHPAVRLEPILSRERDLYVSLVTEAIGQKYADITDRFARQALRIHDARRDDSGLFTVRKEVLRIDATGTLVGFTTLTFKRGGSVKTGPTILLDRYRGQGFGAATRHALEDHARGVRRTRKLYCTCPDTSPHVIRYLLGAGYVVEAHLRQQYATTHGELVFGKMLTEPGAPVPILRRPRSTSGTVCEADDLRTVDVVERFRATFSSTWFPITTTFARRVLASTAQSRGAYESKPRDCLAVRSGRRCLGLALLVPKRGGAVKCMLLTETAHKPTLVRLVRAVEERLRGQGRRKAFFLHPLNDPVILESLRTLSYTWEGTLREAYVPGQAVGILSKVL